jgi:Type I phosphodiesterase / nucleotide pyrophosphatase
MALSACAGFGQLVKVIASGESRTLRQRPPDQPPNAPSRPTLLILAIDGMDRDLLYSMLAGGDLPELAALLGREGSGFPHAYFAPDVLATFPSTTGVAWATIFTGVSPAEHGFAGNEFFVRETREFAAPIPVSVHASAQALSVFTEGYADKFLSAPTIYEVMRARDPYIDIWVSMSQFYRGADQFLMTRRSVIGAALEAFLAGHTEKNLPRAVWADLDKEDVQVVVDRLGRDPLPDVLTVYVFGTDDWAHISPEGPDPARRSYMKQVIDPALGSLRRRLIERAALDDRYVVVVSDHGHTQVMKDDAHALSNKDDDPPSLLARAGYRVRPLEGEVKDSDPFQSVLAYQGAVAYVYLADRASCADGSSPCDWTRPPRYDEDVLPAAEAFYRNNLDGSIAPGMRQTLDLVLTRRPVPFAEEDAPFEVYVGDGRTEPVEAHLRAHPRPSYVALGTRLRDLAVGPHGERAGDILLVAHNGDRDRPEERYYFASPYHSWHGSPSLQDSRIPLIVAHPKKSAAALQATVRSYLGQDTRSQLIGALLVGLREETR